MIVGSKKYNTSSAATPEEATRNGMRTCNASDTNCRVYYADCSFAERVQYACILNRRESFLAFVLSLVSNVARGYPDRQQSLQLKQY